MIIRIKIKGQWDIKGVFRARFNNYLVNSGRYMPLLPLGAILGLKVLQLGML